MGTQGKKRNSNNQIYNIMSFSKSITTKSGYKTKIDRYVVLKNGKRYTTIWGKTKAYKTAKSMCNNLFEQNNDSIEIVNENTGACFKFQ